MIHVAPGIAICEAELGVSYVRSSGPGGQNVNKTNSKAVLRWNVRASRGLRDDIKARFLSRFASRITDAGDIILTSDRYRDQPRNLDDCLEKLTRMLGEVAVAPVKRRPTQPGRAARERRIHSKKARGSLKSLRGRIDND